MMSRRWSLAAATAVVGTWAWLAGAAAQGPGAPNALQGFAVNRDQPVRIEAATLEVRDKSKVAKFLGNVKLTQGELTLTCKSLDVYYEDAQGSSQSASAAPGQGGSQQIRRVEALGGVRVTQKDQTATGDRGELDMRTNVITLAGNVVVTQGKNVIRGDRLVVDLNSGVSRVEGRKGVDLLLDPGSAPAQKGEAPRETPSRDAPKRGTGGPLRLN